MKHILSVLAIIVVLIACVKSEKDNNQNAFGIH